MCSQNISGASHGADLAYFFETALTDIFPPLDEEGVTVSSKLLKMWINFSKTG
jgi:carboxylesterase type B